MNVYILYGIIFLLFVLSIYFASKPYKIGVSKKLDTKIIEENRKARDESERIQELINEKESKKNQLTTEINNLISEYAIKRTQLSDEFGRRKAQLEDEIVELAKQSAKANLQLIDNELQEKIKELELIKEQKLKDFDDFTKDILNKMENLKSLEHAAIEARMREYENKDQEAFYTIQLTERDIAEINEIIEVIEMFRNPTPIRKALFEIYYRKPLKDLRQRVTKGKKISGIYKITLIETGQCYIGQSVDISNRWLQHCKRGFGVEPVTNNKLYPEMQKYGIHNFKYEIIEEVEKDLLTEREKYWSEYFGAKIFGYTMKA